MTLVTHVGTGLSTKARSQLRFSGRITSVGLWVHVSILAFGLAAIPPLHWLGFAEVRIHAVDVLVPAAMVGVAMACHAFVTGFRRLATLAEAIGLFVLLGLVLAIWQYLATASPFPFYDAQVTALDLALGFDWLTASEAFKRHPLLLQVLGEAYGVIWFEVALILVVLALCGHNRALSKFFAMFIACYAATLLGHFLLPLIPPPAQIANLRMKSGHIKGTLTFVNVIKGLRDGSGRTFDSARIYGLISLPSFHAVVAVLSSWTARPVRPLFLASLPLNLCMLVSTVPCGGHYLLDVIAGVMVAALVIAGVEAAFRRRLASLQVA